MATSSDLVDGLARAAVCTLGRVLVMVGIRTGCNSQDHDVTTDITFNGAQFSIFWRTIPFCTGGG